MLRRAAVSLLLVGCVDYGIVRKGDAEPDADRPGASDEVALGQGACPLDEAAPIDVVADDTCAFEPQTGTLDVVVEWHLDTFTVESHAAGAFATTVGQLTDDDGDGAIGPGDTPDIAVVSVEDNGGPGGGPGGGSGGGTGGPGGAGTGGTDGTGGTSSFSFASTGTGTGGGTGAGSASSGGGSSGGGSSGGGPWSDRPFEQGTLRILSGDGSRVHWSRPQWNWEGQVLSANPLSTVALGDVDGDGRPEAVLTMLVNRRGRAVLGVVDAQTSDIEWANLDHDAIFGHEAPAIADVDQDGDAEIVWRRWVFDGRTGALVGAGPPGANGRDDDYFNAGGHSFPLDLDGDGQMEIVTGTALFAADGAERCRFPGPDGYPAAADLDRDTRGEVVVVGQNEVRVFEDDCTLAARWPTASGVRGGPPTIADFDGDGDPEIGLADMFFYAVHEADGTELWRHAITETSSGATGSSVFDFDGDGQAEVLYADEETLWILHGGTGAVRVEWRDHCSGTRNELPLVADVDGDGSTEIVLAHNRHHQGTCGDRGVTVLASADDSWMPSRPVWNQAAYHITNIDDDLQLPRPARPNWPTRNSFRSADLIEREGMRAPNATPLLADLCTETCEATGQVTVTVRVASIGAEPLPAGVPVTAFAEVGGALAPLQTRTTAAEVSPGRTTPGLSFVLDPADLPEGDVVIAVDDDGEGGQVFGECDDTDNTLRVTGVACP